MTSISSFRRWAMLSLLAATVALTSPVGVQAGESGKKCDATAEQSAARAVPGTNLERERDTRGIVDSSEIPAGATVATDPSFSTTIPVWFHVIAASTSPRQGWVSDKAIAEQIDVLNRGFAGGYGGTDTGFRFELAGTTRTINPEWFAMETFAAEMEAKEALKRGDARTMNIYSNSGAGFLGWAYFPQIVTSPQYEVLDGIVIHFDSMPGGKIKGFNLGHTATHEAGHWLGLYHTFEQGCTGHGDRVDDTPAQLVPTSGCPEGKDTCGSPGVDPIHNFMDYSTDPCYSEFTAGQADREQEQYLFWRVKHG